MNVYFQFFLPCRKQDLKQDRQNSSWRDLPLLITKLKLVLEEEIKEKYFVSTISDSSLYSRWKTCLLARLSLPAVVSHGGTFSCHIAQRSLVQNPAPVNSFSRADRCKYTWLCCSDQASNIGLAKTSLSSSASNISIKLRQARPLSAVNFQRRTG